MRLETPTWEFSPEAKQNPDLVIQPAPGVSVNPSSQIEEEIKGDSSGENIEFDVDNVSDSGVDETVALLQDLGGQPPLV